MGILGIGVDLVYSPSNNLSISRRGAPRLASRILSSHELLDWIHRALPAKTVSLPFGVLADTSSGLSCTFDRISRLYRWAVKERR